MMKEFIDILHKYRHERWCKSIIIDTNNNLQNILDQLKELQKNLSNELFKLNLSNKQENIENCHKLLDDINTVKNIKIYFKELEKEVYTDKMNNNKIIFKEKLIFFPIGKDICPECNIKLSSYPFDCQKKIDNIIKCVPLNGFICPRCNKLFILYREIKGIDFTNTNITLDFKYHKKKEK